MSKQPVDLLRLFSYNENKIKKLYLLYARDFPEHRKDWENIAAEEKEHAAALRELSEQFCAKDSFTRVSPYGYSILNYAKHFLDCQIKLVQKHKITSRQALNTAIRLELSLVERRTFDIFTPASDDIAKVLSRLNRETEEHAKRLRKLLN